MITHVCLSGCLFVRSFMTLVVFSRKYESEFHEIGLRCSASVPNVTVNFSDLKVKVHGQNRSTENLTTTVAQPWFKICSPNLAIRQK